MEAKGRQRIMMGAAALAVFALGVITALSAVRLLGSESQASAPPSEAPATKSAPDSLERPTERLAFPPERRHQLALDGAPLRGAEDAPITLVLFSDYQCPFCARMEGSLARLLGEYPDTVRLAFRHLPLASHKQAGLAHRAAIAAQNQGRFWEMHDRIMANPRKLTRGTFVGYAEDLGLDRRRFEGDLSDRGLDGVLARDRREAESIGIATPPSLVINGKLVQGGQPYGNLKALIERERTRLAGAGEKTLPGSGDVTQREIKEWVSVSREARQVRRGPRRLQ